VHDSSTTSAQKLNRLVRPAAWPWLLLTTVVATILTSGFTGFTNGFTSFTNGFTSFTNELVSFTSKFTIPPNELTIFTNDLTRVPLIVLAVGLAFTITFGVLRAFRRVNLNCEVEGPNANWHSLIRSHWPGVTQLDSVWHVTEQRATQTPYHQKINAGADYIIHRQRVKVALSPHARVKSNLGLPTFIDGKHSISFLPDRILVRSGSSWSYHDYSDLRLSCHRQRVTEPGTGPDNSQRVGKTWQYANKNGGPDGRFKNNRELSVVLYGEVKLITPTGFCWILQLSRPETAATMTTILQAHPSLKTVTR